MVHVNIGISSHILEIPNDADTTLSQNMMACSTLKSSVLKAEWLMLENNKRATLPNLGDHR